MPIKEQAKDKGSKISLITIAIMLVNQSQNAVSNGNTRMGAAMLVAAGVLLLVYEYRSEVKLPQ